MPTIHQHFLHACHVKVVLFALGPVAPAPPFPPAPVTRRAHFPVQVELRLPIVQHHGELGATWVEVEPACFTVVEEAGDILLAGVAVAGEVPRRPGEELEGAFGVERVGDGSGRDGTVHVKVVVADSAPVARADAHFFAAVALEWEFRVVEFEPVVWVAYVGDLSVFHCV